MNASDEIVFGPKENYENFEERVSNSSLKTSENLYTFRTFQNIDSLQNLIKNPENNNKTCGII